MKNNILKITLFSLIILIISCSGGYEGDYLSYNQEDDYFYEETEGETYKDYGINPEISTEETNISTFSIDVDTGSYSIARRFITQNNMLPQPESVRAEEFINYFNYYYDFPEDDIFNINLEMAKSFFREEKYILRIGIQGKDISYEERKPANLVFLIDVSGSMDYPNKLPLVKESMKILLDNLKEGDMVGIAVYAGDAGVYMKSKEISEKEEIIKKINALNSGGSTNAEGGIKIAYEMVSENYIEDGINRVILCSDGDANVGRVDPIELLDIVEQYRDLGITLSTFGYGMGNYNDYFMEQLANKGDGNYGYIDSIEEAERTFGEKLTSILEVIARDVKVQVEFNKDLVNTFRLIGYENRMLEEEEFEEEETDAGEVGAAHSVTALYELTLKDEIADETSQLVEFRMRWKDDNLSSTNSEGDNYEKTQILYNNEVEENLNNTSSYYRLTVLIGEFAEILRETPYVEGNSLGNISENIETILKELKNYDEEYGELLKLVKLAAKLKQ